MQRSAAPASAWCQAARMLPVLLVLHLALPADYVVPSCCCHLPSPPAHPTHPPTLLLLPLQAGYILPCSAKPLSDCVVEVRCACMPLPGRVHYLLARMDCLPACPIAE
jgi:hypothetical protein